MVCFRTLGISALAAVGCGPIAGTPLRDDDDGGSVHGGDGASSSSDGTGVDTTVDDTDTPEPVPTLCGAADITSPIAVLGIDGGLAVLRGDGSTAALELPPPSGVNLISSVQARGDFVAVVSASSTFDTVVHYDSEVHLLHADGALSWSAFEPDAYVSSPQVGVDGTIIATRSLEDNSSGSAVYQDGATLLTTTNFYPTGPLGRDGLAPGSWYADSITRVGWLSSFDGSLRETTFTPLVTWSPRPNGHIVYLTMDGPWRIVTDSPTGASSFEIPALAGADPAALLVLFSPSYDWMLARNGLSGASIRVSVATGVTDSVLVSWPAGVWEFDCYATGMQLDDSGGVLVATRDDQAARAQRFDPSSGTLTPIGEAVTAVDGMNISAFGDTYLVQTQGQGKTFCPPQTFEPSDTPLVGTTTQVVRPSDGVSLPVVTDGAWPSISPDGLCVAVIGAPNTTVTDLVSGEERILTGVQSVTWWSPSQ